MPASPDGGEWISLADEDDDSTWLFDVAFLTSNYHCIYGQGCPGIESEPDPTGTVGCCAHGAHFVDKEDRQNVIDAAARLTDEQWQLKDRAEEKGGPLKKKGGDWITRTHKGACIFLNRDGFAGGSGCALHIGAMAAGVEPLRWKPAVCWQVPIRLDVHTDDYGHETVLLRAWRRRDWGPGGEDFHWWCTEESVAYSAAEPVYLNAKAELVELMGKELYERLVNQLERRAVETPVALGT
ncbi:MAG: hypothetical protein AAF467_22570 [Actinomycetota bacterium]